MGGVFLNIDYKRTERAFIELGVTDFTSFFKQDYSSHLFEDLETGKIDPEYFYGAFRRTAKMEVSNAEIKGAWNAMLGSFPSERLVWLEGVKKRYNIYLYSNTNQIHYDCIMETFRKENGLPDFNQYFIKTYYSHLFGLRKPYVSSYLKLLEDEHLTADETLFIDDTLKNTEGAAEAGMQVICLAPPVTVLDLDL